jgi:hypothetical protein
MAAYFVNDPLKGESAWYDLNSVLMSWAEAVPMVKSVENALDFLLWPERSAVVSQEWKRRALGVKLLVRLNIALKHFSISQVP